MKEETYLIIVIILFFIGWTIGGHVEIQYQAIEIANLITAVAAIAAAVAALYSAKTAKEISFHAQQIEFKELLRDLNKTLQQIVSESEYITYLIENIKLSRQLLALNSGQLGGGRHNALNDEVNKKHAKVSSFESEANEISNTQSLLRKKTYTELTDILLLFEIKYSKIKAIKEQLQEELKSIKSSNDKYSK